MSEPYTTRCGYVNPHKTTIDDTTSCDIYFHMLDRKQFAHQAIDALGGTQSVADYLGIDQRVVTNWRVRGLPPDTYAALAPKLMSVGLKFSPELFGQRVVKPLTARRKRNGFAKKRHRRV